MNHSFLGSEAAPHSRAVRQSCGLCCRGITDTVAPSPMRSQACRKRDAQRVLAHKEERLAGGAIWRAGRCAKTTALAFVSPICVKNRTPTPEPWTGGSQPRSGRRPEPSSLGRPPTSCWRRCSQKRKSGGETGLPSSSTDAAPGPAEHGGYSVGAFFSESPWYRTRYPGLPRRCPLWVAEDAL